MKHTPGPWRACYSNEFGGGNIRSDHHRDGTGALLLEATPMFHDYTPDRDEELANLRLAAAAPDLLAVLKRVIEWVDECGYLTGDIIDMTSEDTARSWRDVWQDDDAIVKDAEAAIAKATTGQEE